MNDASPVSSKRSPEAAPPAVADPVAVRRQVRRWRNAGDTIALVPTMGDLHRGHLALIDEARARADRVVVSIFVNPLQFGSGEDFADYPRVLEQDRGHLGEHGADLAFVPAVATLYPDGPEHSVRIGVPGLDDILCGADRPGHFAGVATVVAKLFNIVEPDLAVFGEKDYQQLLLIRRLVRDLDFGIEIVGAPTVREPDRLALSSRNRYLTADERRVAPVLNEVLRDVAARLVAGERDFRRLEADAEAELEAAGFEPRYVAIRRAGDLSRPAAADPAAALRVLAAARLGRARLIDNVAVAPS